MASANNGTTRLVEASEEGDAEVVRVLLAAPGIDVNRADRYGNTPLIWASYRGHPDVVRLLLGAQGIDVNRADKRGNTPLYWASYNGHLGVVKLLLAVPRINVKRAGEDGWTPLYAASKNGHTEVVKLLVAAPGINVNQINNALSISSIEKIKSILIQAKSSKKNAISLEQVKKNEQSAARAKAKANAKAKAKEQANTLELMATKVKILVNKAQQTGNASAALNAVTNMRKEAFKIHKQIFETNFETEKSRAETALGNINVKLKIAQNAANAKAANAKAANAKAIIDTANKIKKIITGNISVLNNINFTNLSDEDLKGILQALSVKGITDKHKETMKNLLKIWIERGKTLNSAQISKNSTFIKSLNADIKRITTNYALRQKFKNTSANTIKRALLSQNGKKKIIKTYNLDIPDLSTIPEIVSALRKSNSFKNSITLNSLKKEYQNLREAFAGVNNKIIQNQLNAAINSIPNNPNAVSANANANAANAKANANPNAELRAKVNRVMRNIPNELLSKKVKVGLVLKSNGNPYKLVNYNKINQAIKEFKDTGENQTLNNNDIITKAGNGTWSLVEVPEKFLTPE